jgi:hypothetical protein
MMTIIESKLKLVRNAKAQIQKGQFTNDDLLTLLEKFQVRGGEVSYKGGTTEQTNVLGETTLSTSFEMSVNLSKKEARMIGAAFQGNKGMLDFDSIKRLKKEIDGSITFKVMSQGNVTTSIMSKPSYIVGTRLDDQIESRAKHMLVQSVLRGIATSGLYQMDPSASYTPKSVDIDDESIKDPADAMLLMKRVYLPHNKDIHNFIDGVTIGSGQTFPNTARVVFAKSLKSMFQEGIDNTASLVKRFKRVERREARNIPSTPKDPKVQEIHNIQYDDCIAKLPDITEEPESMFSNARRAI